MKIEALVEKFGQVENAGGLFYLAFAYHSAIGQMTQELAVRVPMKHEQPSPGDQKALLEAVTVQGGLGRWVEKDDGSVWLMPTE